MEKRYPLGRYGLSVTLAVLFAVSLVVQWLAGLPHEWHEAVAHQQDFSLDAYFWRELNETMANWQSEFLQLLTFVVLTSKLIHHGSHESKDGQEAFEANMDRRLTAIERAIAAQRRQEQP
jgi:hypothetical protein